MGRVRHGVVGTLVVVLGAALVGCSHPGPFHRPPADPVAASRTLGGAPPWVAEPTGDDCGTVDVQVGERLTLPADALACLTAAADAGRPASLAWVMYTTEGDPTPSFARVGGGSTGTGVEVASTSQWDAYGGDGGWDTYRCTAVADLPFGDGCDAGDDQ
ncbi:hypothetical protein SAMN05660766_0169 [Curtobacterium sp. 314Chir4.1]|uniref:hypothetical protein n=1 Tax=Curtobacterium sp. 314Chir4.1 TaxID=1279028 RepID=UPI000BCE9516|nr:hypothetical protein [Curtobacterium sp. 314Chir4.1]SOC86518.1 hypothetical protein SAMN05660766_0169 [Curtobacterium sp. 314Chir4.1]